MKEPATPPDEAERFAKLRSLNILDTLPEERFDRITRMARRMFNVPVALVSLVDSNRQWFKSNAGLEALETPRCVSLCGHAILGREVFNVPDATRDERFADNPLVVEDPAIRFYAGFPLHLGEGSAIGTLCIIDKEPRHLAEEDFEMLKDLGHMVERELASLQMATTDELTGLSNRRGFNILAEYSLHLCVRQKLPACLAYFDLNKFKPINDRFGHAEGDLALVAFASQIRIVFRESDIFARLGGDEFVVLLTNASKEDTEPVIERFRETVDAYNTVAARGYDIAFAHGLVEFDHQRHDSVEALLADADALMYEAKGKS